jgi:hypothetical protein
MQIDFIFVSILCFDFDLDLDFDFELLFFNKFFPTLVEVV